MIDVVERKDIFVDAASVRRKGRIFLGRFLR